MWLNSILAFILQFGFMANGSTTPALTHPKTKKRPPNLILLIGDGMGLSQMSSALYYGNQNPNYQRCTTVGLSKTSSSSHKITDSAAGATAFSTGKKTYNGAIGVGPDSLPLPTLLEDLAAKGWRTGLVATSSITHATPASFYAHVPSRRQEFTIAEQMLQAPVHFFAGGGKRFFTERLDAKNLLTSAKKERWHLDTIGLEPKEWQPNKRYGFLLAQDAMPRALDGRGNYLTEATKLGFNYFDTFSEEPFFLMVEGSQIDWGGHANDGEYLTTEMLDFDKAIGVALDYAQQDGNTLVIVTADHECGGFALVSEEVEVPFQGKQRDYDSLRFSFTSGGHSATMVPVLAYGPGAEKFTGIYENTTIYHKVKAILKQ
jgi:alkaline phosphatase